LAIDAVSSANTATGYRPTGQIAKKASRCKIDGLARLQLRCYWQTENAAHYSPTTNLATSVDHCRIRQDGSAELGDKSL